MSTKPQPAPSPPVVGVEGEMANLTVSSPGEGEGGNKGASV